MNVRTNLTQLLMCCAIFQSEKVILRKLCRNHCPLQHHWYQGVISYQSRSDGSFSYMPKCCCLPLISTITSSQASNLRYFKTLPSDRATSVKCRATSNVAKNGFKNTNMLIVVILALPSLHFGAVAGHISS